MVRTVACGIVLCAVAAALGQPGRGPSVDTMEGLRVAVNATAEEWWVILPVVQRVVAARQMAAMLENGGLGAGGEPAGRGPRVEAATQAAASDALSNERKLGSADALKEARADLAAAQGELRLLLTEQQQAVIVKQGYLVAK